MGLSSLIKFIKMDLFQTLCMSLWEGGAYLGNIISEFFKFVKADKPLLYAAVVARSYDIFNEQQKR